MGVAEPEDNPYVRAPEVDFRPVEALDRATAEREVELLREAIRYHDYRYYVEHDPVIADRTYDALFDRLLTLEETFELTDPASPTQRVAPEPVDAFDTVEHEAPMLSLDASGEFADVREFDRRVREEVGPVSYVLEPKFDGVAIELVYLDGTFDRAVTRGDGYEGDDITRNARTIRAVPEELFGEPPSELAVRGELYMPKDGFQALNRERVQAGKDPFANPRNAAAGTLRQHDPEVVAERPLSCFVFEVLATSDPWETLWVEHEALSRFGLPVSELTKRVDDIEGAREYRDELLAQRDELNYEVDGVVIKVNDRDKRETLGTTARASRAAYAFKFPAKTEETTIEEITVQIGRTGRVTPLALLSPVDVAGVTVSRASLHNFEEVKRKNVNEGDVVRVERAGDVIPYVAEVVEKRSEGHFEAPQRCPICDSPIEFEGPLAFCTGGRDCPAQLREAVIHFTGDRGLDIEGFGEETVRQFMDEGLIEESVADVFKLDGAEIRRLEGWGEQSARNLMNELEGAKEPPLADLIAALGIPEVGPTLARKLARAYESIETLADAHEDDLADIEDVGPIVAEAIVDWFDSPDNLDLVAELDDLGVEPQPPSDRRTGDRFADQTIVFTGSLPTLTRQEATDRVEREGGTVTSSVSGNTDYLVVGENPGQRKREAADEHDVTVIEGADFEDWLSGDEEEPNQLTLDDL